MENAGGHGVTAGAGGARGLARIAVAQALVQGESRALAS